MKWLLIVLIPTMVWGQASRILKQRRLLEKENDAIRKATAAAAAKINAPGEKVETPTTSVEESSSVSVSRNLSKKKQKELKQLGAKINIRKKKVAEEETDDLSNGSKIINQPVAVLGVDESIDDYLEEKNKSRTAELLRKRRRLKGQYTLEDQAAFEFRRRYRKLYWKRYKNRRWDRFVKENWKDFKERYVKALSENDGPI